MTPTLNFDELINPLKPVVIALSGGVDSVVMAHLAKKWCESNGAALSAIHVHHGLSPNADHWVKFVEEFCAHRGIALTVCRVELNRKPGDSLEDIARKARYEALLTTSQDGAQVLLAHHLDDQLETMLIALKRGSGSLRLKGIAKTLATPCSRVLVRPFLEMTKQEILSLAQSEHLTWIEDESNTDNVYDRNFLRNDVIPSLKQRWPGILTATKRTARILSDEQEIVALHADHLLRTTQGDHGGLMIKSLEQLMPVERKLVIRHWIMSKGLPGPREDKTAAIYKEVALAKAGQQPKYKISGATISRDKGAIHLGIS